MTEDPSRLENKIDEAAAACSCAALRRASRAVTQSFDAVLRPSGLRTTQLSLLVALGKLGRVPVSRLAQALVMDRTTLTRNLRPLERRGLIRIEAGEDRRSREIALSPAGRDALERALPLWQEAQARVVQGLGPDRWRGLMDDLRLLVARNPMK